MSINGLFNQKEAWLSMLFVAKDFQRQGIGSFAVRYAEQYVREREFVKLKMQTDADNLAAVNFCLTCGYQIYDQKSKIKFEKVLPIS